MITKISNCTVVSDGVCKSDFNIYYKDKTITAVTSENFSCDYEIDAEGKYVSSGFIDIHTHGGGGCDFMDGTQEAFLIPAAAHAKHGTTALYPTVTSGSFEEIMDTCEMFSQVCRMYHNGAKFMGLHLEGPYFAMSQKGAQNEKYICNPNPDEYITIIRRFPNCIKRWSAAPELEGSEAFARYLNDNGVLVSMGHTETDCIGAYKAFEYGFSHITHLYSCTTSIYRKNAKRYAGLNEAAYLHDDLTFEIIADGIHLPPELLQFVHKFKSPDKVALVTDSMRAAAYKEGTSILGSLENGIPVVVEDGVAKLQDRSAFAGSIATMDLLVKNMVTMGGASVAEAVKMASQTPANIMKLNNMGLIKEGYLADMIIFDENINIYRTIIDGRTVFDINNPDTK